MGGYGWFKEANCLLFCYYVERLSICVATREQHLRHKYGIDLVDYNQMLSEQDGKCKICKAEVKRLVVDHCHITKRVRGLLCNHCNVGIGMLKESENIMREALNYINEHNVKKEGSI